MAKRRHHSGGFLSRLARDPSGNVLALTGAAIIPMVGLVGGALDAARLYTVQARLQSACDAGALAGRRIMGTGRWADNNDRANTVATQTFDLNFASNFFGTSNRSRTFLESDGTVTGTASADVPMTLLRIFNMPTKTVQVTCEGQMRIPNTDVMFVLDNSGSMDEMIPGDSTGLKKMAGLHRAIRCFYEALARTNIAEVSPMDCGVTSDPSGDLSTQVQLRFGFVNYDNMVNVGKLLPQDFIVDSWAYQSREARSADVQTVRAWTVGSQTSTEWGAWSSTPGYYADPNYYQSTYTVVSADTRLADGVTYPRKATPTDVNSCNALNRYGSNDKLVGITETSGSASTGSWSGSTPVYVNDSTYDTDQNMSVPGSRTQTVSYGYRYSYYKNGSTWGCWLERAQAKTSGNVNQYTQTRTGTATKPITWTAYQRILKWTYAPRTFDVSGLKAADGTWNDSITLPIGRTRRTNVMLSGTQSAVTIETPADATVAWEGCIEERQTFKNVDGTPGDDWLNYPARPEDAFDMNIDAVPDRTDPRTQWRPLLTTAVWGRRTGLNGNLWSGDYTIDPVESGPNTSSNDAGRNLSNNTCVTPSRRLTNYNGQSGNQSAQDFSNYVGSITPHNNTYHDIGLLWGARLMSPTGIFANENATTRGGAQIQRHMIFMTDGATATTINNYASYGLEWWDRRQVEPSGPNDSTFNNKLIANNNARSNALCTAIKNRNITLWVIYYGSSDAATKTRLTNCATSPTYFFEASNTPALIAKFREIADRISNLRLTQ